MVGRTVAAMLVAGVMALAWLGAGHASRQAVRTATEAFSRRTTLATLPPLQTVGRKAAADKNI